MSTSKRVLIVDDEPDIREVLTVCLQLATDWIVFSAASGTECLQIAPTLRPDLIVLDSMMPGMDGIATLERLRECPQCAEVPVVMLSAKTQLESDPMLQRFRAAGTLLKPFDPSTISDQLKEFVAI